MSFRRIVHDVRVRACVQFAILISYTLFIALKCSVTVGDDFHSQNLYLLERKCYLRAKWNAISPESIFALLAHHPQNYRMQTDDNGQSIDSCLFVLLFAFDRKLVCFASLSKPKFMQFHAFRIYYFSLIPWISSFQFRPLMIKSIFLVCSPTRTLQTHINNSFPSKYFWLSSYSLGYLHKTCSRSYGDDSKRREIFGLTIDWMNIILGQLACWNQIGRDFIVWLNEISTFFSVGGIIFALNEACNSRQLSRHRHKLAITTWLLIQFRQCANIESKHCCIVVLLLWEHK